MRHPRVIAVTVTDHSGLDAPVDPRFGRAAAFLLVQGGAVLKTLENTAVNAAHGAGTGAAALMAAHGVGLVISGRFGPKALAALTGLGVETHVVPTGMNAGEALASLEQPPADPRP
jgi:predicted Fe-Mo cluster-binding NifX family protein